MREKYAALEKKLEEHAYKIRQTDDKDAKPKWPKSVHVALRHKYLELPTGLPYFDCLPDFQNWDEIYQSIFPHNQNIYITNLDAEVLTIDYTVHYRLNNIPRADGLWLRAIKPSVYGHSPTIDLALCPEEHMASLAIELPAPDMAAGTPNVRHCDPHILLEKGNHTILFAMMAASIFGTYRDTIACLGLQWHPSSFPFREFAYAIVSSAAGNFSLCHPSDVSKSHLATHLQTSWSDQNNTGKEDAPLFQFGSMSHLPDQPPGAAPTETTYWLPGCFSEALVSLVLVVDGKAATDAMAWGIASRESHGADGGRFYMVIISLFDVSLAEVSWSSSDKALPHLRMSDPMPLSPIRPDDCLSTHPRERPVFNEEADEEVQHETYKIYMCWDRYAADPSNIEDDFPGIAALANYFDALIRRRDTTAISSSHGVPHDQGNRRGRLPYELYPLILDYVDHKTWKACLTVSPDFRTFCMSKYRLDDHTALIDGHGQWLGSKDGYGAMQFFTERLQTKEIYEMHQGRGGMDPYGTPDYEWMAIIGEGDRRVAMLAMAQAVGQIHKSDLVDEHGVAHVMVWPILSM